ncbi:MAG: hypothetical protein J5689_01425, partial [Clostridia bacterium]|nr:hypothetical protein [Clostridia bacterium]
MIKRDFNKFIFNGKRIKNPQSLLCAILLPTNINEDNIIPWLNKVEIFIEADLQRDYCNLNKKHFRTLKKKNKELVNFDKVKYILNNKGYGSNGGYNKDKKQINLYEVNKHIKESLIDLILTLAHEMRHHAQVYGLIPDQLKLEKSNPITRYHYFIEMIMLFYDKKNDHSIKTDDIYRLEDAMSFAYYGDEHEMDARMYSLNLVYDMLDSLDRTNLTKDQKEMLKKHRKILLRHMQNEVELMSRIESVDKNIIKNMFKLVKTERDKIYKSKEFKEAYQHYFEGETDDLHRDVLYI